jgi:hypothetical protein
MGRSKAKAFGKSIFFAASSVSLFGSSGPRLDSPMVPLTVSSTISFGADCSSADAGGTSPRVMAAAKASKRRQ